MDYRVETWRMSRPVQRVGTLSNLPPPTSHLPPPTSHLTPHTSLPSLAPIRRSIRQCYYHCYIEQNRQ